MNEINPIVSIVVPTYGRAETLKATILSLTSQTYEDIEIIVVDDNGLGSENQLNTKKCVESINDRRIIYIPHLNNLNGSAARNTGIHNATGEYICFLDDDDTFLPNKVHQQLEIVRGYDFCICGHIKMASNKRIQSSLPNSLCNYLDVLLYKYDLCSGSTLMIKTEVCKAIGGFDESLSRYQDYNFLARVSEKYKGVINNFFGVIINVHEGSYKPKTFDKIEKNTLDYLRSIECILLRMRYCDRKMVVNENYYILIKKAILSKKISKIIKYSLKYKGKINLLQRLRNDYRRVKKSENN